MERGMTRSFNGEPTFLGFFEDHITECEYVAKKNGWSDSTKGDYRRIILEKIVPALKNHNFRSIAEYEPTDFESAIKLIEKQGKSKDSKSFKPYKKSTLKKYSFLIKAVLVVAERYGLYMNPITNDGKKSPSKQPKVPVIIPKSLTISQEKAVYHYLSSKIKKCGQNVGLLLMFALGLRNAEACGVSFSHIYEMKGFPGNYYLRTPQTTENDSNTTKLGGKSINAPRSIPLPNYLVNLLFEILDERRKKLEKDGILHVHPKDLPIACKDSSYSQRCSSDDITEAGRTMFVEIGMRKEEYFALGRELSKILTAATESEDYNIFNIYEKDPTSYLLRRNFATHMMILGLSETEMEYIIGHKMEDEYINRSSYTDEKLLIQIKTKLDNRPILNNIDNMPSKEICAGETRIIDGNYQESFRIPTNSIHKIILDVTSKEPGDSIIVTTQVCSPKLTVTKECGKSSTTLPDQFPHAISIQRTYHFAYNKI